MHNLTELVIDKIWRYYWVERKQVFLKDIKNKNHKLFFKPILNLRFNHPIREFLFLA
jgi:hypothetical protein